MSKVRCFRAGLLAVVLVLAMGLASCAGGSGQAAFAPEDAKTLLDSGAFDPSMGEVNGSVVAGLYGLDAASIQDSVCYMAANSSVSADELTILALTDEAAAQAAVDACKNRVQNQIATCRSYAPAAVPRLEGAVIRQAGNTVLLAVGDPQLLSGAVDGLLQ